MITWLIGMSGAGKTTIGKVVYNNLKQKMDNLIFLDGDDFREIFGNDLGHNIEDRKKNADRICRICHLLDKNNINVICCILSIFEESREWNRNNFNSYKEVYLKVPLTELERRDTKGLYKGGREGEIENVVGYDIPFEEPQKPTLTIDNSGTKSVEEIAAIIEAHILEGR